MTPLMTWSHRSGIALLLLIAAPLASASETDGETRGEAGGEYASGVVFHDRNRDVIV